MANSDEKVSKFVQAITDYAEEQRQKIHQEVEDYKIERLTQAEQEVLADAYDLIQRERMELKNNASREMSRRELDARKKLLGKRRDMTETIFAEVKEQLAAYTATPEYRQSLKDSLTAMAAPVPPEGTGDAGLIPDLTALCPAGSRVETSADIHLGGLRGLNAATGMLADDSLDTKLDIQREWFAKTSGLTVE